MGYSAGFALPRRPEPQRRQNETRIFTNEHEFMRDHLTRRCYFWPIKTLLHIALLWLTATSAGQALDFTYVNTNGTITITGYNGPGGAVSIPSSIAGLPVTAVGAAAFFELTNLTNVTIPDSVTNIGGGSFASCPNLASVLMGESVIRIGVSAFNFCTSLASVTLPDSVIDIENGGAAMGAGNFGAFSHCTSLTNVTFGKSITNIGDYAFYDCTRLARVAIPGSVARIGSGGFWGCTNLINVVVGNGVTNVGEDVFIDCPNLLGVYFQGNAPSGFHEFDPMSKAIVYYLPRTIGWGAMWDSQPTVLWNPQAQVHDGNFGVRQSGFGFNIRGTADIPIVVEASTDPTAGLWVPLESSTLTNGSIYFSDRQRTNYPTRFYHIRSP